MAGGTWGMGSHWTPKHRHYRVLCPVCGEERILTKTQYLNQLKFRCSKCQALRPILEELSEKTKI